MGAGRLGTSLALAVRERGGRVVAYTSRTQAGRKRAERHLGMPASADLRDLLAQRPTIIFLTVPDQVLPQVADELADALQSPSDSGESGRSGPQSDQVPALVVHTSGATPVHVLAPLARLGHPTLALHPLQTFAEPLAGAAKMAGSAFAVTAGPLCSYQQGAQLALSLGGRPFLLKEEDRPIYHAAAVFASNYLVTLASLAEQLAQAAGLSAESALQSLLPLMQGSLDNLAAQGSVRALTGPLSRGDETTVTLHLASLSHKHPELLPAYLALARATLPLVARRGKVPATTIDRMSALLDREESARLDSLPPRGAQPLNP